MDLFFKINMTLSLSWKGSSLYQNAFYIEKFEDTKGIIRSHQSKKDVLISLLFNFFLFVKYTLIDIMY
jgi:hypothetical protein